LESNIEGTPGLGVRRPDGKSQNLEIFEKSTELPHSIRKIKNVPPPSTLYPFVLIFNRLRVEGAPNTPPPRDRKRSKRDVEGERKDERILNTCWMDVQSSEISSGRNSVT
jgi:hypothetical protein